MSKSRPGLTHIQVSTVTRDRLRAFLAKMIAQQESGIIEEFDINCEPINPLALGVSFDTLINWLIDYKERHRKRRKEQREREKAARVDDQADDQQQ
jgi:hypothetical protein